MRILIPIILLMAFFSGFSAFAEEKAVKEKELARLQQRIEKLRQTIEVKENSKSSISRELRQIEKQIGQVSVKISQTNHSLKSKKKSLSSLQKNKVKLEKNIQSHNQELAHQVHSAYTLGQQEQLKLLFSQKNASQLQRNLTYYEYFNRYRLQLIISAQKNYQELEQNEVKIKAAQADLEKTLAEQREQKNKLDSGRLKREKVVTRLEQELKKQGKKLSHLEEDAKHLSQLIDSLSEILTDIPTPPALHQKFAQLRGKLAWPVKGKVQKMFGRPKPPSQLRWQGNVIIAPVGNNVRAISHGRVAFADWLRGMGNLVIIDHGDGYLSLYGHNESLYKETGDWVEAGDIIASIGNSGGHKNPGLYFEIRKNNKPQNPSKWCNTSNWFAT